MPHRRVESLWMKHFGAGDADESQGLVPRDELAECRCDSPPEEDSGPLQRPKISTWEAGWNITNAIQGLFVLGLPFALHQSGYVGLIVMISAALICSYTGKILVSCLYEEDESGRPVRVRNTYEDIADACCGNICPGVGGKLVNAAQVVELTMTCLLYLVVGSNLMCHSLFFLPVTPATCSVINFLILLPCMLIRDLRVVSRLSFLCSLAQFLITFIVIGYCLGQSARWAGRGLSAVAVDFDGFQVSVGVIIFSYTSQIYLPPLEESMADRRDFSRMMDCTHALACVLKTAFSLLAFLTWGEQTKEVITDNLPVAVSMMVNVCLLVKALLSYPLPFYAAAEILQNSVLKTDTSSGDVTERQTLLLRASLLVLILVMSLYVPHFSLLMGLTGSVTGALITLMLPALFHLQLKWTQLHMRHKLLDVMILLLGCFCSISGLICSIKRIITAFGDK
ncbi:vesicular inhibitory amino acid transporter isoform X2 [Triplophysa rosa]|uniref:Vesicular inhibitory amino acid transporter n=1 Tax=Triplophysa rosa TaxID=992332 RepID=A0A9W7TJQ3_TRIRA|nr:vesicular inhibitory amino acid transporter isoform X2 [Triplophysa rosa]KAI7800110.1 putative vesicular inhibitory amino acid transporter [Triplophysa rosa]